MSIECLTLSLLFILLCPESWSFRIYAAECSRLVAETTKTGKFLSRDPITAFRGFRLSSRWYWVHMKKWSRTFHSPSADGKAKLGCRKDYYLSLLVWRSIQWYDVIRLRFRTRCKKGKCSYPIPGSYDQEIVWKESLNFHSRLDSSLRQPQTPKCWILSRDRSNLREDGIMGSSSYAFLVIFPARRSSGRTRKDRDSQCCDSRWDKDCNTMSLTYIFQVECGEWSWIWWLTDELAVMRGPYHSVMSSCLPFYPMLFWLLSSWDLPRWFFRVTFWFVCREPTSRSSCWEASSGYSTRRRLHLFFLWHHNLYYGMEKGEKEFFFWTESTFCEAAIQDSWFKPAPILHLALYKKGAVESPIVLIAEFFQYIPIYFHSLPLSFTLSLCRHFSFFNLLCNIKIYHNF